MSAQKPHRNAHSSPWYETGLKFGCRQCGRCCTGAPGYVWLKEKEMQQIARFLKIALREFQNRFCRRVFWRTSLLERPNGDCIFFIPAGCRIYTVRPAQCKSFPFWEQSLASRDEWNALKTRCPGVGKGRRYSRDELEAIRDGRTPTS